MEPLMKFMAAMASLALAFVTVILLAACYATPLWAPKLGWTPDQDKGWVGIVTMTVFLACCTGLGAGGCAMLAFARRAQ